MKKKLNKLKAKKKLCGGRLSGYVTNLQRLRKLRPAAELGPELVIGGDFALNIDGFLPRNAATIVHNETNGNKPGCLDCNISGVGGGFTTLLTRETTPGEVFRVSMDIKNISYVGGLKIKVGAGEAVIAAALTNDWVTYTVDDTAISITKLFELHRDGTIGAFLADNLSVRKIL